MPLRGSASAPRSTSLWHLPHRYLDASSLTPLARGARRATRSPRVGRVVAKRVLPTRKGLRIFHAVLRDDSGLLECVWPGPGLPRPHHPRGPAAAGVGPGAVLSRPPARAARVRHPGRRGRRRSPAPEGRVLPIYPATEGLGHRHHPRAHRAAPRRAHPAHRRPAAAGAVAQALGLPDAARRAPRRCTVPSSAAEAELGRRRLAFDELFDLQLMLARARALAKRQRSGVALVEQRHLHRRAARIAAVAAHRATRSGRSRRSPPTWRRRSACTGC